MSDIQPGDVVECVSLSKNLCKKHGNEPEPDLPGGFVTGRIYRVVRAVPGPFQSCDGPGLILDGHLHASLSGACAGRFRKLNDTADDIELIALIKQCGKVKA